MIAENTTHAVGSGLLPIPKALYSCKYCYEDYSWPADDLNWSAKVEGWVCSNCWEEEDHGEHGIRLDKEITRQSGSTHPTAMNYPEKPTVKCAHEPRAGGGSGAVPGSPTKCIEAVARGLVRKWEMESKLTRYMSGDDENQLVEICLHVFDVGKSQNEKLTDSPRKTVD